MSRQTWGSERCFQESVETNLLLLVGHFQMLSKTLIVRSVPFLWVSDHDPSAWTMYKVINYKQIYWTCYRLTSICFSHAICLYHFSIESRGH